MLTSTGYSYRGTKFNSQHPHCGILSVTPVPMPSSGLFTQDNIIHTVHRYTYMQAKYPYPQNESNYVLKNFRKKQFKFISQ